MKKMAVVVAIAVMVLAAAAEPALSHSAHALSVTDLTRNANAVVNGQVTALESRWTDNGKMIVTHATITVERVVKGFVTAETVVVEYLGGEVDGIGLKVSNVVMPQQGDRMVLFLSAAVERSSHTLRTLVGHSQGQFFVDNSGFVSLPGVHHHGTVSRSLHSALHAGDGRIPVADFEELIRQAGE